MRNLQPSRFATLAAALLGMAMLLLIHRYWGIDHDATLYLGQALALRNPDVYGRDLFFAFGNQGEYTAFPWLVARLMDGVPPVRLFLWGGLAGLFTFAAASWYCLRTLLPEGRRYWSWLAVLCLPTFYGRTVIFSYAEPFFTPRPLAEACGLLAVALAARGRMAWALGCIAAAGLLHPLQAIAALLVLWPWAVLRDRRWLHALWLAIPVALAAWLGIKPFDGLLRVMDPQWVTELRGITGQLFLTGWPQFDYQYLAFDAAVLWWAWRTQKNGFGHWCLAALAGLGLGTAASLVLVDELHLVLPTSLQLWRVHWLAHFLAMAALGLALLGDFEARQWPRALLLALTGLLAWGTLPWAWVPFALLYAAWPKACMYMRPHVRALLGAVAGIALGLLLVQDIAMEWIPFRLAGERLDLFAIDRRLLAFPLLALGLPLLGLYAWRRGGHRARIVLVSCGLLPLAALAALRWDIRTPQRLTVEVHAHDPALFGVTLPLHARVYWHDMSLVATWLALERADYYDPQQLSGIAFNPGTIAEARRRISQISPLLDVLNTCKQAPRGSGYSTCHIPDSVLAHACMKNEAAPPDYIILPVHLPFLRMGSWRQSNTAHPELLVDWSLYSCSSLSSELQAHQPRQTAQPALPSRTLGS